MRGAAPRPRRATHATATCLSHPPRSYSLNDWKDDAKALMMRAGVEGRPLALILADTAIVHEVMLEDVNNILNSGEVPNLFAADEVNTIVNAVGAEAKAAAKAAQARAATTAADAAAAGDGAGGAAAAASAASSAPLSNGDIYAYFVRKCARNLHVVLAFSPMAAAFRARLRAFPALVNCCYIDYFSEWPAEALRSVATSVLAGDLTALAAAGKPAMGPVLFSGGKAAAKAGAAAAEAEGEDGAAAKPAALLAPEELTRIIDVCVSMQTTASQLCRDFAAEQGRRNYVTPTSYLQLLRLFVAMLSSKRAAFAAQESRYRKGVNSITSTEAMVAVMQEELRALQPVLERSKEETAKMMVDIEEQQKEADATRLICEREEKVCAQTAAQAQRMKSECEADLAVALPALEAAMNALKTLSKNDLVVVKSMQKPPNGVRLVMETVCIVLGVAPTKVKGPDGRMNVNDYWVSSQKHLLRCGRARLNSRSVSVPPRPPPLLPPPCAATRTS